MFKIVQALKDLIPPLNPDERQQLEQNCKEEGIRDPLVIAEYPDENGEVNTVLADGHNRYAIATENGLQFDTTTKQFESLDAIKLWMIDNQKGRRNLSDWVKLELAQVKREILAAKGKEKQGERTDLLSIMDKRFEQKHNTREEIAKDLGWSSGKIARAEKVRKHIETNEDQDLRQKLRTNEVSINQAYQELKEKEKAAKIAERKAYIEQQKRDIEQQNLPEINSEYDLLVFDPPWPYGREYDPQSSRVANPYPEMSIQEIKNIDVPAKEDSIMFLWTTHQFLRDAFEILDEWGYTYKATMVWNKEKIGMGHWLRMQCEFCLLAVKGKPIWDITDWRDIFSEPRREHSRKPESFFNQMPPNELIKKTKLASIGPQTSLTLKKYNKHPDIEASEYTTSGLAEAILEYYRIK